MFSGVAAVSLLSLGEQEAALGIGWAGEEQGPGLAVHELTPGQHDIYGSDQSIF